LNVSPYWQGVIDVFVALSMFICLVLMGMMMYVDHHDKKMMKKWGWNPEQELEEDDDENENES